MIESDTVLVLYDMTDADTFAAAITKWSSCISENKHAQVVLVATKEDTELERVVPRQVAQDFALCEEYLHVEILQTSGIARLRKIIYDRYVWLRISLFVFPYHLCSRPKEFVLPQYDDDVSSNGSSVEKVVVADEFEPTSIFTALNQPKIHPAKPIKKDIWLYNRSKNRGMFIPGVQPREEHAAIEKHRQELRENTGHSAKHYMKATCSSLKAEKQQPKINDSQSPPRRRRRGRQESKLHDQMTFSRRQQIVGGSSKNSCSKSRPFDLKVAVKSKEKAMAVSVAANDPLSTIATDLVEKLAAPDLEAKQTYIQVVTDELRAHSLSHRNLDSARVLLTLRVEFNRGKSSTLTIREGQDVMAVLNQFKADHAHLLENDPVGRGVLDRRVSALLSRCKWSHSHGLEAELKLHGIRRLILNS